MEPIVLPSRDYEIPVPELPPEVKIRGHLLGCIEDLKYVDHDSRTQQNSLDSSQRTIRQVSMMAR